jgi:hypothetical protein
MPGNRDSERVRDILRRKLGSIKQAPLPPGAPSWDSILDETWKDIKRQAKARKIGYRQFRKLLIDPRFDKP